MPRCKNCKEKYDSKHFNQKYCFKTECVKIWVKTSKVQNWKKEKKKLITELETTQALMKKAQKYFNTFIRVRDKGKNCISCHKVLNSKFDAGHYFSSGGHKAVTFDENNVHGQCVRCNRDLHGNLLEYQDGLIKRIGQQNLYTLHNLAHRPIKFSRDEINDIIDLYKSKAKNLR